MIPDKWIYAALGLAGALVAAFFVLLATTPKDAGCNGCQDWAALEPTALDTTVSPTKPEPAKPEPAPEPQPEPQPVIDNPVLQPVEPLAPACCDCCAGCKCGEACNCKPGYRVCGKDCKCTPFNVPYRCEQCDGVLHIGYTDKASVLPKYQCYRCPASPNGRKPLMYRADVARPAARQRENRQRAVPVDDGWRSWRFGGFGFGFGATGNAQQCFGGT